jgi:RES domain-containing protein
VTVYRICSSRYPANDGTGASLYGPQRWNHKGTRVVYSAESLALCALEVIVNVNELADDYVSISIELPSDLEITSLSVGDLPSGWDAYPSIDATREMGTNWAKGLNHGRAQRALGCDSARAQLHPQSYPCGF